MPAVDACRRAAALLKAGEWCYGTPAQDQNGASVEAKDPRACRWSFAGAIDRVTDDIEDRRLIMNTASRLLLEHAYKWEHGQGKAAVIDLFHRIADVLETDVP